MFLTILLTPGFNRYTRDVTDQRVRPVLHGAACTSGVGARMIRDRSGIKFTRRRLVCGFFGVFFLGGVFFVCLLLFFFGGVVLYVGVIFGCRFFLIIIIFKTTYYKKIFLGFVVLFVVYNFFISFFYNKFSFSHKNNSYADISVNKRS